MTIELAAYLDQAVNQRLLPMAREVGDALEPRLRNIDTYPQNNWTPPYGWIFPSGDVVVQALGNADTLQIYGVIFRIVEAETRPTGIPGKLAKRHWLWLPTITNYFLQRRRLVYQRNVSDSPPIANIPYFQELRFLGGAEIDPLDFTGQFGLDFRFDLVFSVRTNPFPGNR